MVRLDIRVQQIHPLCHDGRVRTEWAVLGRTRGAEALTLRMRNLLKGPAMCAMPDAATDPRPGAYVLRES